MSRPAHPVFSDADKRKRSFRDWPLITITPRELSRCGFFYMGDRDEVVCFHCGQHLGGWELDDVPLEAHLKYSPDCEFALKLRVDNSSSSGTSGTSASTTTIPLHHRQHPKKEVLRARPAASNDDHTRRARDVLEQASRLFPKSVVYAVATEHWLREGRHVTSLHGLCRAILESGAVWRASEEKSEPPPSRSDSEEKLSCKVCFERDISVVLLPCHHQVVCKHCVEMLETCPVCRCGIDEIMEVFWA